MAEPIVLQGAKTSDMGVFVFVLVPVAAFLLCIACVSYKSTVEPCAEDPSAKKSRRRKIE